MAGFAPPPPTALIAQMVVLSTKLVAGYPQLSLPAVAAGTVIPGVHDGAPETALQVFPIVPPAEVQFVPLQQRLGCGWVCGVHVRPGAQPPPESQRHPWLPTMHVVGTPEPAFVPPSLPPRSDPSAPLPPESTPLPASEPDAVCDELPHPQIANARQSGAATVARPSRVRPGIPSW